MKRLVPRLFPFVAFVLAACGGQSCSCLQPIKGGFPIDGRRHESALQLRVTQGALDYLNANGPALVSALLPMGSTFDIPPSCGGSNEVCCLNGQPQTCPLDISVQSFNLTPQPPNVLAGQIRTGLKSQAPIPITINQGITADCYFAIDTSKYTQAPYVEIDPTITFSVDSTTDLTNLAVDAKVSNLDQSMLDITPQSGLGNLLACGAANLSFIKTFIIGQLTTTLQGQIASSVQSSLCAQCKTQDDCDKFADACTGGTCMRKGACLQEIGAQGKLDVGALLSSLSANQSASMDTLAVLGGYADVTAQPSGGISLGMLGGGQGDPHNGCVPMVAAPQAPMVAKWAEYSGETTPRDGKPYHLAIGIHQSHLDTMGWAAFDAGGLCLNVGTPQVALLDASTLAVLMPSLADLTHAGDAPAFLVMRPSQAPTFAIGQGTFDVDQNGNKTIKDPLITVTVKGFSIDFYIWIDERYVRVMTLTGDLTLPLSLDVDGMGQIVPLLGDLTKALTNASVTNSELLAESPDKLKGAFPMLIGLAVGQVAGNLKPIALPAVMGINLSIVSIEPTDNQTFVSIFADFALQTMQRRAAETRALVVSVQAPPTSAFSVENGPDPALAPTVRLALDGDAAFPGGTAGDLEWSWSWNGGGTWSPWSQDANPLVSDVTLWLQGRHSLLVRARDRGAPATTDPSPVALEVLVDTVAPVGAADFAGDEVRFSAKDAVSPASALEYRFRAAGGAWSPWSHGDVVSGPLAAGVDAVQVRDEAGNVGSLEFHGRSQTASSGCGCALGATPTNGAPLYAALLLGGLLALRRRRALPLALAALAIGGCGEAPSQPTLGKDQLLDPIDEVGRYSDAVAASGRIFVSAYDDSLGDLAFTEIDEGALSAAIQWQWIDGVPLDSPVSDPGGYRKGITDPGDDIGRYTSLAVTSGGDPRIAYFDVTHGALKFAAASASDRVWDTHVVDMLPAGKSGLYASLSLDPAGVPSIAYAATGIPDGAGGFLAKLRIATAHGAGPKGSGDWTVTDLDMTKIPCAGLCAKGQACLLVDPMDATKGSTCQATDPMCPAMCATGEACVAQKCVAYLPAVKAPDLIEGTGLFANLRRLKAGSRAVIYYDREPGDLKLALEGAKGSFAVSFIDGMDPATDVGQFAAAEVAPDDSIRVAYIDAIGDRLLYRSVAGGTPGPIEVIDDGLRMDGPHPVGGGATLWTDGNTVRVLYQDQSTADLWQATRSGGNWTRSAIASGATGNGFYPKVVSDGGKLFLTQFVYDRTMPNGTLGFLTATALP